VLVGASLLTECSLPAHTYLVRVLCISALVATVGDVSEPLGGVTAHPERFRLGGALMLANSAVVAGIAVLLFPILRRHDERVAVGYLDPVDRSCAAGHREQLLTHTGGLGMSVGSRSYWWPEGQASSQRMARLRIALEFTESVEDRVRQENVELGESTARRAGQDNRGHDASATACGVLGAYLLERHHVTGGEVIEPAADRRERVLVGEDLGGFLQGLVLVDGHEDRSRTAASGYGHVFAAVGDLVEQLGEVGAELADGHGLGHAEVYLQAYTNVGCCWRS
jgi:hypothetical protein